MIALTKEKREELIVCANEIKKMSTSTHGYKVGNDAFGSNALMLMDVAIAALTADIFGHVDGSGLNFYRHPSATIEYALTQGDEVTTLFTAPPVPEIKLVDPSGFIRKWNNSDDCPLAGLSAKSAVNKAVLAYAQEIKRLNLRNQISQPVPEINKDGYIGLQVSVDVSTCDDDAGHRYFGKVSALSESNGEVVLVIEESERNFTAPPVPEIKLPVMKGYTEPHTKYGEGVVDGYNRCLAEIKRLNGLEK